MCVLAAVIPPVAAIVANRRGPEDRWWDEEYEECGDEQSDEWWAELDGKKRPGDHKDGRKSGDPKDPRNRRDR